MFHLDSQSSQIAVVAVVSSVVSALVTLVVSIIVFRLWHRKQISKTKDHSHVKDLSNIHSAETRDHTGYIDYEVPLEEMSTVTKQTERKDATEYQELGEREISNTPNSYQTVRVV